MGLQARKSLFCILAYFICSDNNNLDVFKIAGLFSERAFIAGRV